MAAWAMVALALFVGIGPKALAGAPALDLVEQTTGLGDVVDLANAGDGRLFIAGQGGTIRIFRDGAVVATPFLDVSALMGSGFEGGLKSVAFHPSYGLNGFFFIHYSDTAGNSVIARYEVSAANPDVADAASGVILLTIAQSTTLHKGGQIGFGPDGFLYVALGDGGPQTDPNCHAQRPDTLLGKLLRLDVDQSVNAPPYHGIPAGNPFGGPGEPSAEVWALGLRNPWRFSFDRLTGDLFIADVGQVMREEINVQPAGSSGGENYGWRVMEGNACHDPDPVDEDCPAGTPSCFAAAYTAPAIDYDRNNGDCSVTGGFAYRGPRIGALRGRYLYGDWCTGNLWAAENDAGTWTPQLLNVSLPGITTFGEDVDGELYLSDGDDLYLLRLPELFLDGFESGDLAAWTVSEGGS